MKRLKLFPLILVICISMSLWAPSALALDDPSLNAQAAVLVDLDSGRVLYSKNMDEQRSMASLTKIMTVLLAVESVEAGEHSMDEVVTAQADCQTGMDEESSTAGIVQGEQMSFRDLLYCAMIHSGNDACNVIASFTSGSIEAFVERMNQRAAELGCTNTVFADPNGLSSDNRTTAYDLYLITAEAMSHEDFAALANTVSYTVPATNMNPAREYHNSNALISSGSPYGGGSYLYSGAAGVKTGYTRAAGYCLVSTAERDGIRCIAVVLGCDGWLNANIEEYKNFEDSITLYDWVFDNFIYRTVLTSEDPIERVSVELAESDTPVTLSPQTDVSFLLPFDLDSSAITTNVTVQEDKLVAPIKAGTVLGQAQILIDGQDYGSINLVNRADVELAKGEYLKMKIAEIFSNGWVIAIILIVLALVIVYIILVSRYRRMRKKHLRERRLREKRLREQREQMNRQASYRQSPPPEPERYQETQEKAPSVEDLFDDDFWNS